MTKRIRTITKRIANSGYTSRRKAETLISEGKSGNEWILDCH